MRARVADEKAAEPHPTARENVASPRRDQRIERRAFGDISEQERAEEREALENLGKYIRPNDMRRFKWNRFTRNFRLEGHSRPPRVFNKHAIIINGSYRIPDSAYEEVVYLDGPPDSAYNNRFLNINPTQRFIKKFKQTDPLHGSYSHQWGRLGEYIEITARPTVIHIRFLKKDIPDRAIEILISRVVEHAQSNQVINPRLLNVQQRGTKKILSMMLNAHQLRTSTTDRLKDVFRKGMKKSRHFLIKQDSPGGVFHDRIENDELLV
jgi:hypothetical protein